MRLGEPWGGSRWILGGAWGSVWEVLGSLLVIFDHTFYDFGRHLASWTRFSLEKLHFVKTNVFCLVFHCFPWSGGTEIKIKFDKNWSWEGLGARNFLLGTLFGDLKWAGGALEGHWGYLEISW